jgi:hypothetical protein
VSVESTAETEAVDAGFTHHDETARQGDVPGAACWPKAPSARRDAVARYAAAERNVLSREAHLPTEVQGEANAGADARLVGDARPAEPGRVSRRL